MWKRGIRVKFLGLGSIIAIQMVVSAANAAPQPLKESPKKQALGKALPEGEKAIYLRVVDAYRRGHVPETYKFRDLMLKHYPNSIYLDNAFYLTGLLDYQRGRMAEAVANFGDIIRRFPKSNKRAAAIYAKSQAYSKLNLPSLSRQLLEQVLDEYPGSPESQRAAMDLHLREGKG